MSVEFSNAYQEILLENLLMVIKQNFVFQTQLKLSENVGKQSAELQKQLEEITTLYNNTKKDSELLAQYKLKAESNVQSHEEKTRIQTALNEEMRNKKLLETQLQEKLKNIEELERKVELLQTAIPETKLKKLLKPSLETFVEEQKPVDGSNF